MLPKSHRLSRPDFIIAKRSGRRLSFPHFSMVVYPSSPAPLLLSSRYSIVTPASLSKSAVIRNRLRRRIYSQLKNLTAGKLVADIILYPKPSMLNLSGEEIGSQLNSALSTLAAG